MVELDTAVIVAILTVIGNLILGFLQIRNLKSQAKKTDTESASILISKAMELSKEEFGNLRLLYDLQKEEYKILYEKYKEVSCERDELKNFYEKYKEEKEAK